MRLILFASILVSITSCHGLRQIPQAYARCAVSPKEFTLLSSPPLNSQDFFKLADIEQPDNDSEFIWFAAGDTKYALCRSPQLRPHNKDRALSGCGSSLWKFDYINGNLQGGGISSIFVCHG
jgi:hypothetical protein